MLYRPSGNLIIGGRSFPTDAPIVNWMEGPKWNAHLEFCQSTPSNERPVCPAGPNQNTQFPFSLKVPRKGTKRYWTRSALRNSKWKNGEDAPYEAVKSVVNQFVLHHDGCSGAAMCFDVLQNERGFSVHFILDNDGTIFQTLDLGLMAFHASLWNDKSIGIEMCNRGDAKLFPGYYKGGKNGPDREVKYCKVNGHTFEAYDYTPEQYDSLRKLSRALLRLLPNLPAEYPQSSPGVQTWDTMPYNASINFAGFIGHYHLTERKWDPGWFDFNDFCGKLRGEYCFYMFPKGAPEPNQDRPIVPKQASKIKADTDKLYELNEARADGGFFPVGPWGDYRLWHGGVHLAAKVGDPVFSAFPGRIVAARMGTSTPIGSVNFILLHHLMTLGARKLDFFALYMHLADEPTGTFEKKAPFLDSDTWKKPLGKDGETVLMDEAVAAGILIGHVGKAGPAELSRGQIHMEIFSKSELFPSEAFPGQPWRVIDGSAGGRFCDAPEVTTAIDDNKDGELSKEELHKFYTGSSGQANRYLVPYFVSEWTMEPAWAEALRAPKDFSTFSPEEIDALVAEQITPGLWWTSTVAAHAKLPVDGIVYHYHPVSFVGWLNQTLFDSQALAEKLGTNAVDKSLAAATPDGVVDDLNDVDGSSMRAVSDTMSDPCNDQLTLKELADGFAAPECSGTP